ncbi:MAG: hypothetical protein JXQ29_07615 [Planctomycetes bacterium]|nr:hypothetical protein [Planctomycetota bacterium]
MDDRSHPGRIPRPPWKRQLVALAAWLAVTASVGLADIIHLRNGGRIEGRVIQETPTHIHVRTRFGSVMRFARDQVARIEKTIDIRDEYETRRAAIKPTDAASLFELHRWCKDNGLTHEAETLLEEVLQADPDHAGAHELKGEVKIRGKWLRPADAEAAGYRLHGGKWLDHDEYMRATGHVPWGSQWITESEYDRLKVKTDMEALLNMELTVVNSAHFGVRTRFPPEHAENLLRLAEQAYDAFLEAIPYPEDAIRNWARIQIYLFGTLEEYQTFFDKYIWPRRYVTREEHYVHYREAGNCMFFFPHPIIALRRSPALPKFADQAALAVNNIGQVMLHRMRKEIYPPDWLQEGMGHFVEEKIFGHCRIFTIMPGQLSSQELIVPDWRNSQDWRKRINRLLVPGEVPSWKVIMKKPLGGINTKELAKVYAVIRMILRKKPGALRAFLDRATKHSWEAVFEEAVGWTPEQIDQELVAFIQENY